MSASSNHMILRSMFNRSAVSVPSQAYSSMAGRQNHEETEEKSRFLSAIVGLFVPEKPLKVSNTKAVPEKLEGKPRNIWECIRHGDSKDIARWIKKHPSDLNADIATNAFGETTVSLLSPIDYAATVGNLDAVKQLHGMGAKFDRHAKDESTQYSTAMQVMYASMGMRESSFIKSDKSPEDMKQILEFVSQHSKLPIDHQNSRGETLLMIASGGCSDAVAPVLGKGANINLVDNAGNTALINAANYGNVEACKRLLDAGADPNAMSSNNISPLWTAWKSISDTKKTEQISSILLAAGADINTVGPDGTNILMRAALKGSLSTVKECLAAGIDVNATNNTDNTKGSTALHYAVAVKNVEIVETLASHGADFHKPNERGESVAKILETKIGGDTRGVTQQVREIMKAHAPANATGENQKTAPQQAKMKL